MTSAPTIIGLDISKTTGVHMKYALESLPDLIGEQDYRDLCIAVGVDTTVLPISGPDFAQGIRLKLVSLDREHRQRLAGLESKGLPL